MNASYRPALGLVVERARTIDPVSLQVRALLRTADNTRLSRTIVRPQALARDTARFAKYLLSHSFLTDQITEEQYRAAIPEAEG